MLYSLTVARRETEECTNAMLSSFKKARNTNEQRVNVVAHVLGVWCHKIMLEKRMLEMAWNAFDDEFLVRGGKESRPAVAHIACNT